jgi:hypothetical protein
MNKRFFEVKQRIHKFNSRDRFIHGLKRIGTRDERIEQILEHEDAHYLTARELGYESKYSLIISRIYLFGKAINADYLPGVILKEEPTDEDARIIALAPQYPSKIDYTIIDGGKQNGLLS